MADEQAIATGPDTRLVLKEWANAAGRCFVSIAPQFKARGGDWRLSHSGLLLAPEVVRELAPAILSLAADIDGAPPESLPTAEERELSRMP